MHTRRHSATFTALLVAALLVGALAMGVVLLASGAPTGLVVATVLAAVPVAPLIGCYLWLDRYEPEPRSLLVLGLGWGAFVATTIALALQFFDHFALQGGRTSEGILAAPLTEEAAKGLFIVLLLLFRRQELDGILDGIVYAGMVGIGFAFTENILYLTSAYMGSGGNPGGLEGAVPLFVIRCLFSPFAHPLFTTFTGIGIGIAVNSRSRPVRVLAPLVGYVLAVTAHGLWNASLLIDAGRNALASYVLVMVPAFLLLVAFAVWVRAREGRILTAALGDCARQGFLEPAEIPWLVRLPARRVCRRYAERAGGRPARRAMVAYQREAIELGYLHHRYLRGTPPPDFAALGQEHVTRMAALRGSLIWPPSRPAGSPVGQAAGGRG